MGGFVSGILHSILTWLWEQAWAQFGLAGLIVAGCIAVVIFVPFKGVKEAAIIVGTLAAAFLFFAPKIYMEGIAHEKALWDAAIIADLERGNKAREDAEKSIPLVPPGQEATDDQAPTVAPPDKRPGVVSRVIRKLRHPRRVRSHDPNDRDGG